MSTSAQMLIENRYRLVLPLGQGGMGRVWKARDEILGRDVAIKELVPPPGLSPEERIEVRERAMREARAVARLNHPGVVRIHDVINTGEGDPWIVMEYLPGGSLHDLLNRDGTLPVRQAARIGLDLLGGLRATHAVGIVHRDIKPANVLMAEDGRAVLTDFGIATVPGDPFVTRTGLLLGSPAYLPPERARGGGKAGPAADLWSLGATLYAAVEGSPPFARSNTMETLAALATEPVPPPRRAGALTPVLNGLLHKDPEARMPLDEAYRQVLTVAHMPDATVRAPSAVPPVPSTPSTKPYEQPSPTMPSPDRTPSSPGRAPVPPPPRAPSSPVPPPPRAPSSPAPPPSRAPSLPGRAQSLPGRAPAPPRRSKTTVISVILIVLGLLAAALAFDDKIIPDASPPATTSSAPAEPSSAAPAQTPSPTPSPAKSDSGGFVLPAGWQMQAHDSGFRVPVPEGWTAGRDKDGRPLWRDPRSGVFLLIDQRRDPQPDPVADWQRNEANRRSGYRDYQRIRIEEVSYWDKAADWEFTYTTDNRNRLHVLNRGFITAPDQAYSIYWATPASQWDAWRDELQVVFDGFVPARS